MNNYPRGYSIVEALATLFIVAIIATLSLANYRSAQESLLLHQVVINMEAAVRDVQQHALAGTVAGAGQTYGYGVHFDQPTKAVIVYADKVNDNKYYDAADDLPLPGQPEQMPSRVTFEIKGCEAVSVADADIVFQPPLPLAYIKKGPQVTDDCTGSIVCLDFSLNGKTSRLKVSKTSGLIETENLIDPSATCP